MTQDSSIFTQLMAVIEDRKANPSDKSYTTKLLNGGAEKIGAKITEEADEVITAAGEFQPDTNNAAPHDHLSHEAADLIYHLFVMLAHRDVRLVDVESKLADRFGVSGLAEKASRGSPNE